MIFSIVVTFNPDIDRLRQVLNALAPQVEQIQIVDNNSKNIDLIYELTSTIRNIFILPLNDNQGIASALNRGIELALKSNHCTEVLLMDQDSIPKESMVSDLLKGLCIASSNDTKVAAIGPRFIDRYTGTLSQHVIFRGWHFSRVPCPRSKMPIKVDFIITSGSLIPVRALASIGLFDENLFIDHVDTEWALRAKALGYQIYGDCMALMEHDLGENRRRIWLGHWRNVPIHKPFRYYYIYRNSLNLLLKPSTPMTWKRADLIRLIEIFIFTLIFNSERKEILVMIFLGLRDGLKKIYGRRKK